MDTHKKLAEIKEDIKQRSESYSDEIVGRVIDLFKERSIKGILKYNTTLNDSEEGLLAFIKHTQEEHMDSILYLEKMKQIING